MMVADAVNAALETAGGVVLWLHVIRAKRDGVIKGVSPWPVLFFAAWAVWNCLYYPLLGQWMSAAAAVMPAIANAAWLRLYWRLGRA